jgi:two-component system phosphate regulon sensor histidine kinase PhoR
MKSLKRILFFRYAVAASLVFLVVALIIALSPSSPAWLVILAGFAILLTLIVGVTYWTEKTLATDLREIGAALEKLVMDRGLDRIPQPRVSEVQELVWDMDTIAARVRRNYELLASEKDKLETILANISAGIIVVGRDGKIELINPVAERILGTSQADALGKAFTEVHHTPAIDKAIERSRRGVEVSEEVRISLPRRRTLRVQASPIRSEEGSASGVICILEDITSRRRLERMRRDFVVNVSHELRTPVANLRAVIDALLSGAWEERETAGRFVADLDRESGRLVGIIEDLLILSRVESDELALEEESFDLYELLGEVVEEKRELAGRSEVEVVFDRAEIDTVLNGDRKLIKTACGNLLDNAIKYNRPGGKVEIFVKDKGDEISIDISDSGIGIPEKEQAKIFERFYRVDKARSRETGGTGLGLSIVKHIAEFHGGSVSVESTPGYGSTFRLTLPRATSLF